MAMLKSIDLYIYTLEIFDNQTMDGYLIRMYYDLHPKSWSRS